MKTTLKTLFSGSLLLISVIGQAQTDTVRWNLSECIQYAIDNNLTIKQAELSYNSAEINYNQTRASVLPSLSANSSFNIMPGQSAIDPVTYKEMTQTTQSASVGLNTSITLFSGLRTYNQIKQNKLSLEKSQLYIEEQKNSITLNIAEAYVQAIFLKENIKTSENNVTASQKQYDLAKAKYDHGALSRTSLADIQSQLASAQHNLVSAQNSLAQQILNIKQMLELEPNQEFDIIIPEISPDSLIVPNKMDIYNRAHEIMPEIKESNLAVDIAEYDVKIAQASYMPSLSASAGLNTRWSSMKDDNIATQFGDNINSSIGFNLSIPIFNKLSTRSRVATSKIQVNQSQLNLTTAEKNLYKKIEQAWTNATAAQSELISAEYSKKSAEEAYSLAQQQFQLGSLSTNELLNSQNSFLSAEVQYLQKKFSCVLYYQLIQFYMGNEIKL